MTTERKKEIKIRLTEAEHQALLERCPKARLAEWMREHCLDVKPARRHTVPSIDPALLRQLAGLGNNLNQIARQLNSGAWTPVYRVQIISWLTDIEREMALLKLEFSNDS